MKIAMIGAGNLATQLSLALAKGKHQVVQIYSRTEQSAAELAGRLGVPYTNSVADVTPDADVYIFSLKDTALEEVAKSLCRHDEKKCYLHTAGSMPMDVFEPYATHYGVLYPMQTFSKQRNVDFKEVPLFLEANSKRAEEVLKELAKNLGGAATMLSSEKRKHLHLAAVWACNFANHCYAVAAEILEEQGIPFSSMLPLIDETARKVHVLAPQKAQTGPAIRYDKNVIDKHLSLLDKDKVKQMLYEAMSKSIHESSKSAQK